VLFGFSAAIGGLLWLGVAFIRSGRKIAPSALLTASLVALVAGVVGLGNETEIGQGDPVPKVAARAAAATPTAANGGVGASAQSPAPAPGPTATIFQGLADIAKVLVDTSPAIGEEIAEVLEAENAETGSETSTTLVPPAPRVTPRVEPTPAIALEVVTDDASALALGITDFPSGWQAESEGRPHEEGYQTRMLKIGNIGAFTGRPEEFVVSWARVFPDVLSAREEFVAIRDDNQGKFPLGQPDIGIISFSYTGNAQFEVTFVLANVLARVTTYTQLGGSLRETETWARAMESKIDAAARPQ